MKWKVTLLVLIQMAMVVVVSELSWKFIFLLAYCFGGVINHALTLGKQDTHIMPRSLDTNRNDCNLLRLWFAAVHEISHNLAFGHSRPLANRLLGFWANLPIAIPMSISFRKYHLEHHRVSGLN
jgi:sphingolipid delta-4 desaturase